MIFDFCAYNIRGLNNKQSFTKDFILSNKFSLFALLETHVAADSASSIANFICPRFKWVFNYDYHANGRIWLGYDPSIWKLQVLSMSSQQISCQISLVSTGESFFLSTIYALNSSVLRRQLWADLLSFKSCIGDIAWTLFGDFNVCFGPDENNKGVNWTSSMMEFKDFLHSAELTDIRSSGSFYTWWDCNISNPTFKKLDRCLINGNWMNLFPLSQASFLVRGLSDHSPIALTLGVEHEKISKPFQFFQHLINAPSFMTDVNTAWNVSIDGNPWHVLSLKLKRVKAVLRCLNSRHGNVHLRVHEAKAALFSFQSNLTSSPSTDQLLHEHSLISALQDAFLEEEIFFKQKSRVSWLQHGDSNNNFFFRACKNRWNSNKILALEDRHGTVLSSHKDISAEAVNYFSECFGYAHPVEDLPEDLELPSLTAAQHDFLIRPFTEADVFKAVKSMPGKKSPGPDGFTREFFIATWDIVGIDFTKAVLYFFQTNYLPKIIGATALTLVPKHFNASKITEFRPIACCNFVYKCISKMVATRLKCLIPDIISANQSAFIPKRLMGDNILLAQSLFRGYHLNSGPSRCAFKLDIKKAFDTVSWSFLFSVLQKMGFPVVFVNWVKACLHSCMISVKINGSLEGFFKANSGLRQGDPISPYLFVICMEVLSSYLRKTERHQLFKFHWKCKGCSISHLMFADDVLLFCNGDADSINLLLSAVNDFGAASGLFINKEKSSAFFANSPDDVISTTLASTGFQRGSLPISYLGLPLFSTKLSARDCSPLTVKIQNQINHWTNSCLNHAGRLQLLKSILFGIQAFWSCNFYLPRAVLKSIQRMFTQFLWGGSSSSPKQIKVSWKECCKSKIEGGLGIRDIFQWNLASHLFHIWRIIHPTRTPSLWIAWIHDSWVKNKSFWTLKIPSNASWCFKKMLLLRPLARRFTSFSIGANSQFFFWQDPWLNHTPIVQTYNSQLISIFESTSHARIEEFLDHRNWNLPLTNHLWAVELRSQITHVNISNVDEIS